MREGLGRARDWKEAGGKLRVTGGETRAQRRCGRQKKGVKIDWTELVRPVKGEQHT